MAHEHHAALVGLDGLGQGVDALHVQVVRGLIQQEQVGVAHADHSDDDAALLSLGERPDLGRLHLPGDAVLPKECAPPVPVPRERRGVGVHVLEKFNAGGGGCVSAPGRAPLASPRPAQLFFFLQPASRNPRAHLSMVSMRASTLCW